MPVGVRKQRCRDSKGNAGTHVTFERSTGKVKSCHGSKAAAEGSARARNAATEKSQQEIDPIKKAFWTGIEKSFDDT